MRRDCGRRDVTALTGCRQWVISILVTTEFSRQRRMNWPTGGSPTAARPASGRQVAAAAGDLKAYAGLRPRLLARSPKPPDHVRRQQAEEHARHHGRPLRGLLTLVVAPHPLDVEEDAPARRAPPGLAAPPTPQRLHGSPVLRALPRDLRLLAHGSPPFEVAPDLAHQGVILAPAVSRHPGHPSEAIRARSHPVPGGSA